MDPRFGPPTLICNARAGRGGVGRSLPLVEAKLRERGLDFEVRHTRGPGDAARIARAALDEGVRFLVAVGGDGTIADVVNAMIEDDRAVEPGAVLGVVTSGTRSGLIKTFGLPDMPGHAVAHLDGPESFPIDIGKATYAVGDERRTRYFHNVANIGWGAGMASVAARLPRAFGPLGFPFAFWVAVLRQGRTRAAIDLVDRTYEEEVANVVVANGQFLSGGMKVAPKAAPTDGLLDVLIDRRRRREAIAQLPRSYRGEHVPHPDIVEAKRVRVVVDTERPLVVEADGGVLGRTPASFEVLKDVINLKV